MGMTREELKEHCEKQIEMCEFWAIGKGEKPTGKVYEEHKLILDLLEQELRWIPVSEGLPENDEDVLVQMSDDSMMVDYRTASSSGWFWAEKDDLPIAWMPLPKPYSEVGA